MVLIFSYKVVPAATATPKGGGGAAGSTARINYGEYGDCGGHMVLAR
jgi:hypothetical protein